MCFSFFFLTAALSAERARAHWIDLWFREVNYCPKNDAWGDAASVIGLSPPVAR
jgi:hypothetical protein